MNKYDSETIDYFRENPLVQDIKERIRQLAIEDKQEGAQDRYIFEEPSSFMQRERTCAKYIGKVSFYRNSCPKLNFKRSFLAQLQSYLQYGNC